MSQKLKHYFKLNKPYGYLCQFTGESHDKLLGDLHNFPSDVYSIGRLDKDSEGLLLLTNDNQLKTKILSPDSRLPKTYMVQVEGDIDQKSIELLESGTIIISHKVKKHKVSKAKCGKINDFHVEDRDPPIRFRKNIPTSWIKLTITEGKNRQVRKMTAATGFPTLRLIRIKIGDIELNNLQSGQVSTFNPIDL